MQKILLKCKKCVVKLKITYKICHHTRVLYYYGKNRVKNEYKNNNNIKRLKTLSQNTKRCQIALISQITYKLYHYIRVLY